MNGDERTTRETLVDQKDALSVYLQALLREDVPDAPSVAEPAVDETPESATPVIAEAPAVSPSIETNTVDEVDVRPPWGRQRFQAMLFKVAGLTLAVPLSELHGIREWSGQPVTSMPGRVAWYMGLTGYRGRQVPVIDTAQLVLPEDKRARLSVGPDERITRIVFIGDGSWGLGCDQVNEVISLEPGEVRWRTERTRRRWLAGTVIKHMCALLDPRVFAEMLAAGAKDMALEQEDRAENAHASS